jgi:hypothetical protein
MVAIVPDMFQVPISVPTGSRVKMASAALASLSGR